MPIFSKHDRVVCTNHVQRRFVGRAGRIIRSIEDMDPEMYRVRWDGNKSISDEFVANLVLESEYGQTAQVDWIGVIGGTVR